MYNDDLIISFRQTGDIATLIIAIDFLNSLNRVQHNIFIYDE